MNVLGFEFPDAFHYDVENQVWARVDGDGLVAVGITSLGIHLAGGEIYMARPKSVGQVVEAGRSVAVVELAKSVVAVKSPLAGRVLQINTALADRPELVHLDPYGQGWLARLEPADWAADAARLVHGAAVPVAMQRHAALFRVDGADSLPPVAE